MFNFITFHHHWIWVDRTYLNPVQRFSVTAQHDFWESPSGTHKFWSGLIKVETSESWDSHFQICKNITGLRLFGLPLFSSFPSMHSFDKVTIWSRFLWFTSLCLANLLRTTRLSLLHFSGYFLAGIFVSKLLPWTSKLQLGLLCERLHYGISVYCVFERSSPAATCFSVWWLW